MQKKFLTLLFLFLFLSTGLFAQLFGGLQHLNLEIGVQGGAGLLNHKTRFETTPMHNLYKTIEISHRPEVYSWDDFLEDYGLRSSYWQPRFGFNGLLTYGKVPLFFMAEAMSSPSSYQKMAVSGTLGVGQDFYFADSLNYISFKGGYKIVQDFGFGSSTLVNSIRNDEARSLIATYFDPKQPIGSPRGNLFVVRLGAGTVLGYYERVKLGAELFGEVDLTPATSRESRMSNFGALVYLRFVL